MAGLKIGDGWVSIEYAGGLDRRQMYHYCIDLPGFEYEATDLSSGCGGGTLQQGLESLLSFLGAFAESRRYGNPESDNWNMFPEKLAEWATENADEIGILASDLGETVYIKEVEDKL
jgi:hypothetical protein